MEKENVCSLVKLERKCKKGLCQHFEERSKLKAEYVSRPRSSSQQKQEDEERKKRKRHCSKHLYKLVTTGLHEVWKRGQIRIISVLPHVRSR